MQQRRVTWAPHWPLGRIADANIGDESGVYVIWYVDRDGIRVLDVGQGVVADRLAQHLYDYPSWEEAAFTWTQ